MFRSSFPTTTTLAANQNNTFSNVVPNPLASLAWRLRPVTVHIAQHQDDKCDMKSVDKAVKDFDVLFSDESSQHWMEHVNEIERKHASKHKWNPRQFYYALVGSLTGKARKTVDMMEKGFEIPKFSDYVHS